MGTRRGSRHSRLALSLLGFFSSAVVALVDLDTVPDEPVLDWHHEEVCADLASDAGEQRLASCQLEALLKQIAESRSHVLRAASLALSQKFLDPAALNKATDQLRHDWVYIGKLSNVQLPLTWTSQRTPLESSTSPFHDEIREDQQLYMVQDQPQETNGTNKPNGDSNTTNSTTNSNSNTSSNSFTSSSSSSDLQTKQPKSKPQPRPNPWAGTMACVLVGASFATMRKRRSFDLFSPMLHSRGLVASAFTIASLVALNVANGWRVESFADNPFALYLVQLCVCFFGVFLTMPIVVGGYQGSPRWLIVASLLFCLMFVFMWLLTGTSALRFFFRRDMHESAAGQDATAIIVTVLSSVLLVHSARQVALHFFPWNPRFPPFAQVHKQECIAYVKGLLRGGLPGEKPTLPTRAPVALIVALLGVCCFMTILFCRLFFWSYGDYKGLHRAVLHGLEPLQPFFTWAGYPLPLDDMNFALKRILVCWLISLCFCVAAVVWMLLSVLGGYERLFTNMAKRKPYQGRAILNAYGPSVFHPMWGTYFAGALVGNCVMASFMVGLIVFVMTVVLSLEQFWQALWAAREWGIFYGLLYLTRTFFFRAIVPWYVVTQDGSILQRRVWALLFPTLTLLNFVVGATSGLLRSVVLTPFLLVRFFRVDITFLPEGLEDWDWSFQPFLSLVTHAHARLNPIMWAAVLSLNDGRSEEQSFRRHHSSPGPSTTLSSSFPASLFSDDPNNVRSRPLQTLLLPAASRNAAPSSGGALATAGIDPADLEQSEGSRTLEEGPPNSLTLAKRSSTALRARNRWHLAKLLARNESLRQWRGHAILEAAGLPAEAADAEEHAQEMETEFRAAAAGGAGGSFAATAAAAAADAAFLGPAAAGDHSGPARASGPGPGPSSSFPRRAATFHDLGRRAPAPISSWSGRDEAWLQQQRAPPASPLLERPSNRARMAALVRSATSGDDTPLQSVGMSNSFFR